MYVEHMVEVFREVHRVLRDDGTLWLNIGDTYWGGKGRSNFAKVKEMGRREGVLEKDHHNATGGRGATRPQDNRHEVLKPKDLVGVPWRLALALQEDGWWLRNAIIWHKANRLPHPVRDRLTASYEFIFLFAKSRQYSFNLDAIRIPHTYGEYDEDGNFEPAQRWLSENPDRTDRKLDQTEGQLGNLAGPPRRVGRGLYNSKGKNPGDVWLFPTQPFPGAHFAVFPPELPERCILAGTSDKGVCGSCATPWQPVVEKGEFKTAKGGKPHSKEYTDAAWMGTDTRTSGVAADNSAGSGFGSYERKVVGWKPACDCGVEKPSRSVVLDPFSGSGTTGMVALKLGRDYIGCDLNPAYLEMAKARVVGGRPPEEPPPVEDGSVLDLFGEAS